MSQVCSRSRWWLAALIGPALPITIGYLWVLALPPELKGGWDVIERMWLGAIGGAAVASALAAVSLLKKENLRYVALLTGIPGAILLLCAAIWFCRYIVFA